MEEAMNKGHVEIARYLGAVLEIGKHSRCVDSSNLGLSIFFSNLLGGQDRYVSAQDSAGLRRLL